MLFFFCLYGRRGGGATACVYLSLAVSQPGHSYRFPRDNNMLNELLSELSSRADMPIIASV